MALLGSGSIAWLLADREFIGGRWMKFLLENNVADFSDSGQRFQ